VSAFERQSVISGIGQSAIGRRLDRTGVDLTIEAAQEAVADAGLTFADIDGLATYPGGGAGGSDFAGPGVVEMQDALRLGLNWYSGSAEGAAQIQAVINAVLAVGAGLARHVLVYRTVTEATGQGSGGRRPIGVGGGAGAGGMVQWTLPFRAYSAANWLALYAQRHFYEFGTTREQLSQIALNARRNAELNPKAILREPMSSSDYFAARMITTPFCLFDCDIPADGSTAVVVSVAEHGRAVDHAAPVVEAVGTGFVDRPSWDQRADLTTMGALDAARSMWARTDLTAADVDIAELYDGFSFLTMSWLEALGFCGHGESGPFVEGGARIARDGELPLNTNGGQLSGGRLHGFGFLHEACAQLRGDAGDRQVGRPLDVAVVGNGGGPVAGCLLLTRE
jgi:acetyl-CoA acetyltransferase